MQILQLCPLNNIYGFAGFYHAQNQYFQFRITENHKYLKRFKFKRSSMDHSELFELLNMKSQTVGSLGPFPSVSELTLDQLDSVATKMRPNSLECSWTKASLPDYRKHESMIQ